MTHEPSHLDLHCLQRYIVPALVCRAEKVSTGFNVYFMVNWDRIKSLFNNTGDLTSSAESVQFSLVPLVVRAPLIMSLQFFTSPWGALQTPKLSIQKNNTTNFPISISMPTTNHFYPPIFRRKDKDIVIPTHPPSVRLQCHIIAPRPFKLESQTFHRG